MPSASPACPTTRRKWPSLTDTQSFTITVGNTNDAPTITSSATVNAAENQTAAGTLLASDADVPADSLSWSLTGGGADSGLFTLSPAGVLSFNSAPNFESPGDANGDNVYELEVEVDGVAGDPWGGERVSLTARGEIDREEFGLTWNVALEGGGVLVSKKVVLEIDAQGVRES